MNVSIVTSDPRAVVVTVSTLAFATFNASEFRDNLMESYASVIAPFKLVIILKGARVSLTPSNIKIMWSIAKTFNDLGSQTKLKVSVVEIKGAATTTATVKTAIGLISSVYKVEKPIKYEST